MINNRKYFYGADSFETAHLTQDYPYGRKLRCQRKEWIETTKRGDRFVYCTLNPKTGRWNKPKKSTYGLVEVLYLNEDNHIKVEGISLHSGGEAILAFHERHIGQLKDIQVQRIKEAKAFANVMKHVEFKVVKSPVGPIDLTAAMNGDPVEQAKVEEQKRLDDEREAKDKEFYSKINRAIACESRNPELMKGTN